MKLGASHADYGDTPRAIGSMLAIREGFDAIAYLDADNFFLRDHIKVMVDALAAADGEFDVVTSRRYLMRPDGTRLPVPDESYQSHTDTNCYLILRGAFSLTPIWAQMPREFSMIGDRVFWRAIVARGCRIAHVARESVGYCSLEDSLRAGGRDAARRREGHHGGDQGGRAMVGGASRARQDPRQPHAGV